MASGLLLAWALAALVPRQADETNRQELVDKLRNWALPVMAVYAVVAIVFFLVVAGQAGGIARLLTGDLALFFWLGLIVVGLAGPAGLAWLGKKNAGVHALAAFLLVAVGGLVMRAMLFPLGTRISITNLW